MVWVAWAGWTALMLALFWMPPPPAPRWDWPWLDEAIHVGSFFGWAVLARAARRTPRWVVAIGLGLAIVTELVQAVLPWGRTADISDVAADAVGLGLGLGLAWLAGIARTR